MGRAAERRVDGVVEMLREITGYLTQDFTLLWCSVAHFLLFTPHPLV